MNSLHVCRNEICCATSGILESGCVDCSNCGDDDNLGVTRWTMPLLKLGEKKYYLGIFFKSTSSLWPRFVTPSMTTGAIGPLTAPGRRGALERHEDKFLTVKSSYHSGRRGPRYVTGPDAHAFRRSRFLPTVGGHTFDARVPFYNVDLYDE
ncbi:hypothetical protein EVAR_10098_1 [Eumeta japonica]|uniref:Uncharacterized protein n=1 Tax=Eumeta variegata TaxID=151549 RepID=A0A4C1UCZ6_EUMVA|nr:hypothetical protein EVAR_10098_1 [Eumeta japonica]